MSEDSRHLLTDRRASGNGDRLISFATVMVVQSIEILFLNMRKGGIRGEMTRANNDKSSLPRASLWKVPPIVFHNRRKKLCVHATFFPSRSYTKGNAFTYPHIFVVHEH